MQLVETNQLPSRKRDDRQVGKARRFLQRLQQVEGTPEEAVLADDFPDIYVAYRIYAATDEREIRLSQELRARLLTTAPPQQVADRCALTPEIIQWYGDLFYDVKGRLGSPSYIMHQVIGPSVHAGLHARNVEVLWQLFGYFAGPVVLDAMIDTFIDPARPVHPSELPAFVQDTTSKDLVRQALIAAKTLSINQFNQIELLDIFVKHVAAERQNDGGGASAATGALENINAALRAFSWKVGDTNLTDQPLQYDKLGIELSSKEKLALLAGEELPAPLDAEWTFPDKREPAA